MKTVNVLPALPEGWEWVCSLQGTSWTPFSSAALATLRAGSELRMYPTPAVGTPPAGAIVWDLQTLQDVRFLPWAPGDPVVVRIGTGLHDGVFAWYDFELDDPDVKDRRVVVRTWRGEDAYPLADVFPNREAAWAARDSMEVSNARQA